MTGAGISIWALTVLVFFGALLITCVSSAQEMPPDQGGIAGWLRWYAGCYAFYAVFFLSTSVGGNLSALVSLLFTLPFALAVWVRSPIGRQINSYGNYCIAALCFPVALAGAPEMWVLIGTGVFWGTYFLRSERARVTYGMVVQLR